MRTSRAGRSRHLHRVCPKCGETGRSHVAHHPSGMVVLCLGCGHVHLALRMLRSSAAEPGEEAARPRPDGGAGAVRSAR